MYIITEPTKVMQNMGSHIFSVGQAINEMDLLPFSQDWDLLYDEV